MSDTSASIRSTEADSSAPAIGEVASATASLSIAVAYQGVTSGEVTNRPLFRSVRGCSAIETLDSSPVGVESSCSSINGSASQPDRSEAGPSPSHQCGSGTAPRPLRPQARPRPRGPGRSLRRRRPMVSSRRFAALPLDRDVAGVAGVRSRRERPAGECSHCRDGRLQGPRAARSRGWFLEKRDSLERSGDSAVRGVEILARWYRHPRGGLTFRRCARQRYRPVRIQYPSDRRRY